MNHESLSSPSHARTEEKIALLPDSSDLQKFSADAAIEPFRIVLEVELEFAEAIRNQSRPHVRAAIPKGFKLNRRFRDAARRVFDVACALMGLIILAPLLVAVAAAIKLVDGGPVLFSQSRVGKDLKRFRLLKFRSMIPNAGRKCLLTAPDDPRITRVGRYLRKYKLDELPQLVNVVKGDMQLVGVRPQVECFVELFPAEYALLLEERPGITDLATLVYRNEEKMFRAGSLEKQYVSQMLPRKLRLALQYRKTRTFFSDIGILFRTVLCFKSPVSRWEFRI